MHRAPSWESLARVFDSAPRPAMWGRVEIRTDVSATYLFVADGPRWRVDLPDGRAMVTTDAEGVVVREGNALQRVPPGVDVRWPDDVPPQLLDGPAQLLDSFEDVPEDPVERPGTALAWAGRAAVEFRVHTQAGAPPIKVRLDQETGVVLALLTDEASTDEASTDEASTDEAGTDEAAPTHGASAAVVELHTAPAGSVDAQRFALTEPVRTDWVESQTPSAPLTVPSLTYWPEGTGGDVLQAAPDGSVVVRLRVPGSPLLARVGAGTDLSGIGQGRHVHHWAGDDGWDYALVVDQPLSPDEVRRVAAGIRLLRVSRDDA